MNNKDYKSINVNEDIEDDKSHDIDTSSTIDDDELLIKTTENLSSKLYYLPPNRSNSNTPFFTSTLSPLARTTDDLKDNNISNITSNSSTSTTTPNLHSKLATSSPINASPLTGSSQYVNIQIPPLNLHETIPSDQSIANNNNNNIILTSNIGTDSDQDGSSIGIRYSEDMDQGFVVRSPDSIQDPSPQSFTKSKQMDEDDDEDILKRILEIRNFKFQKKHKRKFIHYLLGLLPFIQWIREYKWKSDFKGDFVAGLTVGVMLIPQGMAYAMVAGLPPIYGLYGSIVPVIVYALFGTSRQLSVGPFAIISLLTLETVNGVVGVDNQDVALRVSVSILLAFLCGLYKIILGLLRFGFVANFLSDPVKTGFISGCALIIGSSQIRHMMGFQVDPTNLLPLLVVRYLIKITHTNWWSMLIGVLGIVSLLGIKKINARFKIKIPGPLVVVAVFTILSFLIDFEKRMNILLVGRVPSGIPSPRFPIIEQSPDSTHPLLDNWMQVAWSLTPGALVLVLVGFISSVSISTKFAEKYSYTIDPNQELVALGASDLFGSFFLSFPVGASLSRTAVNDQSGAISQIASVVTASIVVIAIMLLTKVIYFLPKAILASIVVVAIIDLVELKIAMNLWKVHRKDLMLYCISFISTITLGILQGILIGIIASLLLIIYRSSYPPFALLGRLPGTDIYKNIKRVPQAETFKGIQIVRIDGSIYFANTNFIKKKLRQYEPFRNRGTPGEDIDDFSETDLSGTDNNNMVDIADIATVEIDGHLTKGAIVIDCSSMNDIDSTGIRMLKELVVEFRARQMVIYFASVKGYIRDLLKKGGVVETYGADHFFWTINDAVQHHLYLIRQSRRNYLRKSRADSKRQLKSSVEIKIKDHNPLDGANNNNEDGILMTTFKQ